MTEERVITELQQIGIDAAKKVEDILALEKAQDPAKYMALYGAGHFDHDLIHIYRIMISRCVEERGLKGGIEAALSKIISTENMYEAPKSRYWKPLLKSYLAAFEEECRNRQMEFPTIDLESMLATRPEQLHR